MLSTSALSVRFGRVVALDAFSFAFPDSGLVAVIGPNGAGKSTLLNALTGRVASSGVATLDGLPLRFKQGYRIARMGVRRSFQHRPVVPQMSVRDNVLIAADSETERSLLYSLRILTRSVETAKADMVLRRLRTLGVAAYADELACQTSGGEQRLVSCLRCTTGNPRVILLDEAVTGLDQQHKLHVANEMRSSAAGGSLVIFVEHDLAFVEENADVVIALEQGRLVRSWSPCKPGHELWSKV